MAGWGHEGEGGHGPSHRPWQDPDAPAHIAAGGAPESAPTVGGMSAGLPMRATVWVTERDAEADVVFELLEDQHFDVQIELVNELHPTTGLIRTFQVTVRVDQERRAEAAIAAADLRLWGMKGPEHWDDRWDVEVGADPDEPWPGYWTLRDEISRQMPLASAREKWKAFDRARAEVDPQFRRRQEVRQLAWMFAGLIVVAVVLAILYL